ncbi:hypothetical protein CFOL_v3_17382 [Cephalotus follicularis]|uniref:Uncharacterized protein n=1 Tax=Cephalotus follicularis TaxID=3775 RepID=A0A1Q3C157_CEPFO|nr:hypothetical protein CFOL_v3_17382 [Cephalotus follicularis]
MNSYTPTYYSTLHDSITSLCKTILPFSFKKRRLPASDHKLSKMQSDNLKWQQDSFHQILNLMGLHQEGILAQSEVATFRSHLLETLIASPLEHEQPIILRDKLVFLQELLYAKCISLDEYHASKRPLLQRLAIQGAEIEARDVIVTGARDPEENSEEEWSVIDLKDEKSMLSKESMQNKNKSKHGSAMKQIKGAASVFSFASSHKPSKAKEEKSIFDIEVKFSSSKNELVSSKENPFWNYSNLREKESESRSILMQESVLIESIKERSGGSSNTDKAKRKPFRTLFQKEQKEGHGGGGGDNSQVSGEKLNKSAKKQWGFDGFKKWKRNDSEDETATLPLNERSDSEAYVGSCKLVESPIGEGPDTKQIKRKLHPDGAPTDFFIDKVLGDKIKKELTRIQTELCTTNSSLKFSNDQIEAISTKLPVDKADLKKFFPKSWCDRYGDVVLNVVKKEFKDHMGEMENIRNTAGEKHSSNSMRWITFDDDDSDENCHPNLFAHQDHSLPMKQQNFTSSIKCHAYNSTSNPLCNDYNGSNAAINLMSESAFSHDQNPFWSPSHGSSLVG